MARGEASTHYAAAGVGCSGRLAYTRYRLGLDHWDIENDDDDVDVSRRPLDASLRRPASAVASLEVGLAVLAAGWLCLPVKRLLGDVGWIPFVPLLHG